MKPDKILNTSGFLLERKRAYQLAMPLDGILFQDLNYFCRARETVARDNPNLMFLLEGRRQVFLRIQQHHEMSLEQLLEEYPTLEDYYA